MALPSLRGRHSAPEPEDSGPRPPADYPFPDFQDEGRWAVPVEWRDDYVSVQVDPNLIAGYWSGGSTVYPVYGPEGAPKAIRLMGDVAGSQRETARDLVGKADFPEWIHGQRLHLAARSVKARESAAQMEAMHAPTKPCPACGTLVAPMGGVMAKWVTGFGTVSGCSTCLETLAFLVGAEMVAADAHLEILQAHARALVAEKVGPVELVAGDEE